MPWVSKPTMNWIDAMKYLIECQRREIETLYHMVDIQEKIIENQKGCQHGLGG